MAKTGLKHIALEAGVSPSLVSQILNNREVRVSEETRKRVREIAAKYDYTPNRLASGLKLKRTDTIAVIVPFTPVGFFSELIYHIEAYAMDLGYNTLVINTFGDRRKELQALDLYRSRMADGILIAPQDVGTPNTTLLHMKEEGYPFVFIDRYVDGVDTVRVSSDHAAVAYELTGKLVRQGCRDVMLLKRDDEILNSTKRDRVQGFLAAAADLSIESRVVGFDYSGDGSAALYEALKNEACPDAIFLFSGYYMPCLLEARARLSAGMERMHYATVDPFVIPFSLLKNTKNQYGFNGNLHIAVQDLSVIARRAVATLIAQIRGETPPPDAGGVSVTFERL